MWLYPPSTPVDALSAETVGGKALGLHWLRSWGLAVPETWVLGTQAFDAMLASARVSGLVAQLDQATGHRPDWAATERALQALAGVQGELIHILQTAPLPTAVQLALRMLPQDGRWWAVRSSATVEDHTAHSFAGQFRSFLSVPPGQRLIEAIRAVWASTFEPAALHYRAQHGTDLPRMAVILQPMQAITAADRSGVAFSQSIVPALPGILIQVTFGAGLAVVGGEGGELWCVNGAQAASHSYPPAHMFVTAPQGGMQMLRAPRQAVLTLVEALQLARQVRDIARQFDRPVEVEFFWRSGEAPSFVQVRALADQSTPSA
jgi:phosphoenolpyruvate synthase/pyruvate phosphate dikinase